MKELWQDHLRDPFPAGCAGKEIFGVDLVMLDSDIAGLVSRFIGAGELAPEQRKILAQLMTELEMVIPNLPQRARPYFARLAEIGKSVESGSHAA